MTEKERKQWEDTEELHYDEVVKAKMIEETLKQRGSLYGSFEHQARCVGEIINSVEFMARLNDQEMDCIMKGCVAYIAIKLARFGLNPKGDTSHDLHGYARLIDELYNGEKQ